MMTWDDLLTSRNIGVYHLGDEKTTAERLLEVLPAFGLTPEQVGDIVAAFYADLSKTGPAIKLQRVTKTDNDAIKAVAKKKEKTFNQLTKKWEGENEPDDEDYMYCRLGFAIVEPAVPGDDLRAKADFLAKKLTPIEAKELLRASLQHDSFDLRRAQEQVKN